MFRLCNRMPLGTRRVIGRAAVGASLAALLLGCDFGTKATHAYPGTSPSARAAARLKYRPPSGWIRHYLGDDRYKVKGGTWKVVSTELDQYYYPPWAPEMLRQPAGIVIGFASAQDAEDAGYRRSNYPMDVPTLGSGEGGSGSTTRRAVTTVNRTQRAVRITLADGVSTVMLPPNWRRTQSGAQTLAGRTALADTLQPIGGRGASIRFAFIDAPVRGLNMGALIQPGTFQTVMARANRTGNANSAQVNLVNSMNVSGGTLGGLGGVTIVAKPGMRLPNLRGRVLVAGRGSKVYVAEDNSRGVAGGSSILSSFRAR